MQKLSFTGTPVRAIIYLVVLALIGILMGWGIGKAVAATPAVVVVQDQCATTDSGACRDPNRKARRFKRKFHHGDLGHAHGFNPDRLFAHPKHARKVIVRRIARMLRAARAAGSRTQWGGGGYHLRARGVYHDLVADAPCSTPFSSSQFRAMTGPFIPRDCNMMDSSNLLSKKRLLQGLGVTACFGGVAVTVLTPVGRAAGTAALKFWGALSQMTGCTTMAFLVGEE